MRKPSALRIAGLLALALMGGAWYLLYRWPGAAGAPWVYAAVSLCAALAGVAGAVWCFGSLLWRSARVRQGLPGLESAARGGSKNPPADFLPGDAAPKNAGQDRGLVSGACGRCGVVAVLLYCASHRAVFCGACAPLHIFELSGGWACSVALLPPSLANRARAGATAAGATAGGVR